MDTADYARENRIRVEILADHGITDGPYPKHTYDLRLHYGDTGRTIDTNWMQGLGITPLDPDAPSEDVAAMVFDALLSDATIDADSFEDFASEFGYDSDSRRAFAIWEACVAIREPFAAFVGGKGEVAKLLGLDRL